MQITPSLLSSRRINQMAANLLLCGPPQIYYPTSDGGEDSENEPPSSEDASLLDFEPPIGFTENNSLTYLATGNPCLDFFFHVLPTSPSEDVTRLLSLSWEHNPLTTLKLICNLRGVRGTGKNSFYTAALWLHKHHPKTLASNVGVIADFGYFKDLPEILFRILEGPEVRSVAKHEWELRKNRRGRGAIRRWYFLARKQVQKAKNAEAKKAEKEKRQSRARHPREQRIAANNGKINAEKERARALRKERDLAKAKKAFERYNRDPEYRFLHDKISDLFAERLRFDLRCLDAGEINKIGMAAKWCPSIDSSYDKSTLICESVARKVFPREEYAEYREIEEAHYVYRVRDRLRKEVLVPLHKVLELPEVYMSAGQWDALPYNRVASVAMKKYKNFFLQHDNKRFKDYLKDVRGGKATIAAGALLPHEIIASLRDGDGGQVAELQWGRMVEDVGKKGRLRNCIAVCDVSSSMNGEPMKVCVALGLLISELSEEPWKGNVITFSANPELHRIEGDSLKEKGEWVERMDWGGNTDFQKVFDKILEVAVRGKLKEEQMIKRVFVFSDMEFDEASGHNYLYDYGHRYYESEARAIMGWETDYEVIQRKFREKGYSRVPEIVFWNLRPSPATPVKAEETGVALVSGFSKNIVRVFLDEGIVNPEVTMEKAIAGELYRKLAVHD